MNTTLREFTKGYKLKKFLEGFCWCKRASLIMLLADIVIGVFALSFLPLILLVSIFVWVLAMVFHTSILIGGINLGLER